MNRLGRLINDMFWDNLLRRIDTHNDLHLKSALRDPKHEKETLTLYVPSSAPEQFDEYSKIVTLEFSELEVYRLPKTLTQDFRYMMNQRPGLLALASEEWHNPSTQQREVRGLPYIVPGGLFNEFYGWDSYVAALGLLINDKVEIAKSIVLNFCFCSEHYGLILNANRFYYLDRSQPPFLTDLTLRVYDRIKHEPGATEFLHRAILAAIKEYHQVWMSASRFDPSTGLSRYYPQGTEFRWRQKSRTTSMLFSRTS